MFSTLLLGNPRMPITFPLNFRGRAKLYSSFCGATNAGRLQSLLMAEGVPNAACLVCFMTQAYQDPATPSLELTSAPQSAAPLPPVLP